MAVDRDRMLLSQLDTLRRFARMLARNEDDAEELLQDVAVVVLGHHDGPGDLAAFPPWCRGIARHLRMHRKRTFARRAACIRAIEATGAPAAEDRLERTAIAREQIAAGLSELDETSLRLLFEYALNGASSIELAIRWNVSPGAMRMRLSRLRSAVRSAIENATREG